MTDTKQASPERPHRASKQVVDTFGIRDLYHQALETVAQAAPDDVRDALEVQIIEHRIAITPEYDGGFHAEIYGEEAEPQSKGFGKTPSEAISAALRTQPPAADSQEGGPSNG